MKYQAQLDENNVVVNIIVVNDGDVDTEQLVTYTDSNPAHIGGDFVGGYFYAPQPFSSWTRYEGEWIPPKPRPNSLGNWEWNEREQEWQD